MKRPSIFPDTPRDIACMALCYACTAALAAMAMFPRECAHFLIRCLP
jgi:hypothetical protein